MKRTQKSKDLNSSSHASKPFIRAHNDGFVSDIMRSDDPFISPMIQPKLNIGSPNDKFEKEADSMADKVVNQSNDPQSVHKMEEETPTENAIQPLIQKLSASASPKESDAETVENDQKDTAVAVQPLRAPNAKATEPLISKKQLDSNKNKGKPLDNSTRSFMENQFGQDFSNVSVHDNAKSQGYASSINARAFAYGNDIYFNKGEYKPDTKEGQHTLAHELTHVVQQSGSKGKKSIDPKIQRMSGLGRSLGSGVAPWGAGGPVGTDYEVFTDAGNAVKAWVAYIPYNSALSYWCHGHSLDTYANYGYSVYSGPPLAQVITDEWVSVPPSQTRAGDIAVWTGRYDHSAKFTHPVITGGRLDPAASMLSTKNGQNALATMNLSAIAGIYGSAGIAVFRHV